jgi:hypothetical protein
LNLAPVPSSGIVGHSENASERIFLEIGPVKFGSHHDAALFDVLIRI